MLEDGLRELAKDVRGPTETEDDAYQRVKASRYVTKFKDDPDATFYRVDVRFGRVILTLNRAHPFFDNVYKVLADISTRTAALKESPSDDSDVPSDPELASETAKALVSLDLLFLALARTQAAMTFNDPEGPMAQTFDQLRRQWSLNLEAQLSNM